MGDRDSSQTRVKPVFDELFARDPSGKRWLSKLLSLPGHDPARAPRAYDNLGTLEDAGWGNAEKCLKPPRVLLQWLVCCAERPRNGRIGSSPTTIERREALLARNKLVIGEALALLSGPKLPASGWYILEGLSQPDVFLMTPEIVIVVEGKRTESGPTTETVWMPGRHQMLRHLDCAWEMRGSRSVLGFFIVEGDGGREAVTVPPLWIEAARRTASEEEVLNTSLPHRTKEEQREIASCFLGATTWQAVCNELDLDWSKLPIRIDPAPDDV
jgi:hypothetical protein